jgi:hypothetical protein
MCILQLRVSVRIWQIEQAVKACAVAGIAFLWVLQRNSGWTSTSALGGLCSINWLCWHVVSCWCRLLDGLGMEKTLSVCLTPGDVEKWGGAWWEHHPRGDPDFVGGDQPPREWRFGE